MIIVLLNHKAPPKVLLLQVWQKLWWILHQQGNTLRANALKIIPDGVMLRSQALFCGSLNSSWTQEKMSVLKRILDFISAHERACSYKVLHGSFAPGAKSEVVDCMISYKAQDINISDTGFVCLIDRSRLHSFTEILRASGADIITVSECESVFRSEMNFMIHSVRK